MSLSHILCFLALVGVCAGISCYSCSYVESGDTVYEDTGSGYYSNCDNGDDQSDLPEIDCTGHCFKTVAESSDDNLLCVVRGCFNTTASSADNCPNTLEYYGIRCGLPTGSSLPYVAADRHCCDGDLCNSGEVVSAWTLLNSVLAFSLALLITAH